MTLATSNAAIVRVIKEAVFGVVPNTGNPNVLRYKAESMAFDISKTASAEINSSRTVSSMTPTSAKASGSLSIEMRHLGLEDFMESALQSAFVDFGTAGLGVATPTTGITANAITASAATSGSSIFTALAQGQWFRLVSAGSNNSKILRVSATVAPTATVLTLDASTPAIVSAGESIQIQAARLSNGTTKSSWTIERESNDIGVFIAYKGMTPDKFALKVASGALSDASFDFVGKDALESNATVLPGTPAAADNFEVHSGVSGATNSVWMDGVPVAGTFVKSVDLSYSNSLRAQEAIGSLGAIGIGSGSIQCTLGMQIYFNDKSTFTKYRTNGNTSISFATVDANGNGYVITVPVCNMTSWKSSASGKDQDQMVDLSLTALNDTGNAIAALRKLIFIDRIGVAA